MSFGHPFLLLALLAVPIAVGLYLLAERRRMRYALAYTNLGVLASVAEGRAWRRYVAPLVFLLALAALCVAVARPSRKTLVPRNKATVILVIDVSRSMQAHDVKPTRLAAAQAAVNHFLERAPKRLRIGLIAFAGEAQVAAPPTTDHRLVSQAVDDIGFFEGFGGTAIGDALAAAVQLGEQSVGVDVSAKPATIAYYPIAARPSGPTRGLVSILFLSDGKQTRGVLQPEQGAQRAKDAGIPVFTVALGTKHGVLRGGFGPGGGGFGPGGVPYNGFSTRFPVVPDPATLKKIAQTTGGQFFAAKSAGSVQAAYEHLASKLGRKPGREEITWEFLAAAAALLVAAGVLSSAWSPRLP